MGQREPTHSMPEEVPEEQHMQKPLFLQVAFLGDSGHFLLGASKASVKPEERQSGALYKANLYFRRSKKQAQVLARVKVRS